MSQSKRILLLLGVLAALAGVALFVPRGGPPPEELLASAKAHLQAGRFAESIADTDRLLAIEPESAEGLLVAGEVAIKQERFDEALAYFERVPDDAGPHALTADHVAGDILLHRGRLSEAEAKFRSVLARNPDYIPSHNRLALLLGIEGRRWDSAPHLFELLRADRYTREILMYLGNLEQVLDLPEMIRDFQQKAPDDVVPLLGLARTQLLDGDLDKATDYLRQVLAKRPDLIEAQARQGYLELDKPDASFLAWHAALPPGADDHPDIWVVRGLWAVRHDKPQIAARCFWEAVRRHPNHQQANYQLGQTLRSLKRNAVAQPFLDRAAKLEDVAADLKAIYDNPKRTDLMEKVARQMDALGRPWEAWGWMRLAVGEEPGETFARARAGLAQMHQFLTGKNPPRTTFSPDAVVVASLEAYSLPDWDTPAASPGAGPDEAGGLGIAFTDITDAAGIEFAYHNDADDSTAGMRMFEFSGGGVAVLDYDADGWPDLHFTQGRRYPSDGQPDAEGHRDRLYRNRGDGTAQDVTAQAGVGDPDYSQGASVGDYDGDGFDDLYVSNIGGNRLYHNNGDGTFREVTAETGTGGPPVWSTSSAIADFNADGLPDLYVENYLQGDLTQICRGEGGVSVACSPVIYEAEQDRVYRNLGDGRFADETESSGIVAPGGKGLGLLAADFDGDGRLNIFLSNDAIANFYFVNTSTPGGPLKFEEQALIAGLAFDMAGQSQACMGIASGDVDGDGRLDMFVTNFFRESNTLYKNHPGGLFLDESRPAGVREPSYKLLGFGTQFLDADLDGERDIVITNGDVDDFRHIEGRLWHMPPQLLRNVGGGRFVEVPGKRLGSYFDGVHLGRGLTRLDWDRDGREDFVVTHVGEPVALVANRGTDDNHFLAVRLRGTTSSRDAIGTTVTVTAGGATHTQQLTAGDGFQASNQRQLVFGLGMADRADRLTVRWPSGREQTFQNLAAGEELLVIEDWGEPLKLPR